nr:MAG TPA: hypothetical protein [Caudoviricetes sp.]
MFEKENNKIFVDYTKKIMEKFYILNDKEFPESLNSLIIFLNYCFYDKNNFFVSNYNIKNIMKVNNFYNELKTNIFNKELVITDSKQLFENISSDKVKAVVFIIKNYLYKFNDIFKDESNQELNKIKEICSKERFQKLLNTLK